MAVIKARMLRNVPRRMRLSVISRNQRSPQVNHELEVGV